MDPTPAARTSDPAPSSPATVRWPRFVLAAALAVNLLVGLYGIAQQIVWGHYGFHAGEYGTAAVHLRRHGTWVLCVTPDWRPPARADLNFHHPYLLHQFVAASQSAFGEKPWALRLVPLAFGFAALAGLWALAKRARDERTAALAVAFFAIEPLHAAFGLLPDHQIVAITFALWSGVGLLETLRAPRAGPIALWLAGAALAGLTDWPWYTVAFMVFLAVLVQVRPGGPLARAHGPRELRAIRGATAAFALVVATTFAQHLVVARLVGELGQASGSFWQRAGGMAPLLLLRLIAERFGMLHATVLPLLAVGWLVDAVRRRRTDPGTLLVGAMFGGAIIETSVFRWGFAFHEYRTYWYVPVFAFTAADVVLRAAARWRARGGRASRHAVPLLAGAVGLVVVGFMAPVLALSRARGGAITMRNYDDNLDDLLLARAARAAAGPQGDLLVGASLQPRQEFLWLLDGRFTMLGSVAQASEPAQRGQDVVVVDRAGPMLAHEGWRPMIHAGQLLVVGDAALLVVRRGARPSIELARVARAPRRGLLAAWLHASWRGPARLVPAPRAEAAAMARALGAPLQQQRAVERGETPLLDSLPADLEASSRR